MSEKWRRAEAVPSEAGVSGTVHPFQRPAGPRQSTLAASASSSAISAQRHLFG